ncbi:N-terminal domain of NEFA-interacting nuclear protein NIP30-domain-containing protein [Xylaria sp. FL1042]|nr:N-terminal domain of NEFA-interacting nuclear protein NIP30-domain-containing protein [Xylaria sp. FL1042]
MTSRFVSGGIIAGDDEDGANADKGTVKKGQGRGGTGAAAASSSSVEWEAVQKDLEEDRRRRAEARKRDVEAGGEKSLYEILQANKAAKQAAFEEQNRIRNQFRALDDDEIEFLHGVSDEKRAEEERVRRETEERLANFRKAQQATGSGGDAGDTGAGNADGNADVEEWGPATAAAGRKRKREKERAGFKGVKRRSSMPEEEKKKDERIGAGKAVGGVDGKEDLISSAGRAGDGQSKYTHTKSSVTSAESESVGAKNVSATSSTQASSITATSISKPKSKPPLGLVDYGSDEDEDD